MNARYPNQTSDSDRGVSEHNVPTRETVFGLIRFSVPLAWSDWAVNKLVDRIFADEPDDRIMPAGLTFDERSEYHTRIEQEHDYTQREVHRSI